MEQPEDTARERQENLRTMKFRIESALHDPEIRKQVEVDFRHTFTQLGFEQDDAEDICQEVIRRMETDMPLDQIERDILAYFTSKKIPNENGERNMVEVLDSKMEGRAKLIFSQIREFLMDIEGKTFDYGAGDGRVTQILHEELGLDIEGADVRAYRAPEVDVPIHVFDGKHVNVADDFYKAVVMTNVAHHEKNNEVILRELARICSGRLVIIETVPVGDSPEKLEKDRERTFMNDYLYNRLFHDADIAVPGTYETPMGWIKRIEQLGFRLVVSKDLGFDQPTIRDVHHLLVFEKIDKAETL